MLIFNKNQHNGITRNRIRIRFNYFTFRKFFFFSNTIKWEAD
jgi:hypothetical protein